MALIQGKDGACTLPSGHFATLNTWSATFSHVVNDFTAFTNLGMVRQLGIEDAQGSAGGYMLFGASSNDPGIFGGEDADTAGQHTIGAGGAALVLTAASGCTITFDAIIDSIAVSSVVTGDAAITFNFQMSDATGASVAWSDA